MFETSAQDESTRENDDTDNQNSNIVKAFQKLAILAGGHNMTEQKNKKFCKKKKKQKQKQKQN